jgi:hypothetical protein
MTIVIAWVRRIRDCEELVFVSDSRLSGDGRNFDACPKIIQLSRSDCALAFAGYTGHAYPMMLQLALAIDAHGPLQRGSMDLFALKSHALKIFDEMSGFIKSSPLLSSASEIEPEASFVLGGYSWIRKQFEIWNIAYNKVEKRFVAQPAQWLCYSSLAKKIWLRRNPNLNETTYIGKIVFAGDQAQEAERLLAKKLMPHPGSEIPTRFDMQPFEVVRDMLRNPAHAETIGGAPQVLKVYQYMKSAPLAIYWPRKGSEPPHLQGRPCLGYERIDRWALDPDTLISEQPLPSEDYESESVGIDQAVDEDGMVSASNTNDEKR